LKDESGATAIEYGLIVAVLSLAVIGGMRFFGAGSGEMWDIIGTRVEDEF
jgi:pilus assembly protein Flp/PilA